MARASALRTGGEVPETYSGPVYYRLSENLHAPSRGRRSFRFDEPQSRIDRLYHPGNRWMSIKTSGILLDPDGGLLPEWQVPLKASVAAGKPEREEMLIGDPAIRVSERVHDAIVSLEPGRHLCLAIDVARPDGRTERQYLLYLTGQLYDPPALHPACNRLDPMRYADGTVGYHKPEWASRGSRDRFRFGYLDPDVVADRHFFSVSHLDNAKVLSPQLFAKLEPFGDIYPALYDLVPIGVASPGDRSHSDAPDDVPPAAPRGIWGRLLGR